MNDEVSSTASTEINLPLQSFDDETPTDGQPPSYEPSKTKWDGTTWDMIRIFTFLLIHMCLIPSLLIGSARFLVQNDKKRDHHTQHVAERSMNSFVHAFLATMAISVVLPAVVGLLLLLCGSRIVTCIFILGVVFEVALCVDTLSSVTPWFNAIAPFCGLLITLTSALVVRKSALYDDAHVRVASAILRRRPLLLFTTLGVYIAKILWFLCFLTMLVSVFILPSFLTNDTTTSLSHQSEPVYLSIIKVVFFVVNVLFWLLGAIFITNVVRFITASYVGRLCLGDRRRTSESDIKQAFTTYLPTICFGSVPKRLVEAVISAMEIHAGLERLNRIDFFFVYLYKRMTGCFTGLSLVYEAVARQPFSQATGNRIKLLDTGRRWVLIEMGMYFFLIKITVIFISAIVSSLITHTILMEHPVENIAIMTFSMALVSAVFSYFLISSVTTMFKTCASVVFTCFLIDPVEFQARQPEHFQRLTNFWNKYYSTSLAMESGFHHLLEEHDDVDL